MSLNPAQQQAVDTTSGPLLVLAGAGSGKTRVVTFRIQHLIASGISAERILAVTFTNKAAREMRARTTELLKQKRASSGPRRAKLKPEISTLHSLCVRILRRHAPRLGYPRNFSICDQGDQESIARSALRSVRVGDKTLKPGEFLSIASGFKSRGLDGDAALTAARDEREQLAAMAFGHYQETLRTQGSMDFDDLLLQTERVFEQFEDAREEEAARFDHLMIDEYQDTNASQYRIIKALAKGHRNLCVVGDDDQSIYGWRGAEVEHILSFKNDWPDARIIRLEMNYRSREPILALANTLIAHNRKRHPKQLRAARKGGLAPRFLRFEDEAAEAESLVREIARRTAGEGEDREPLSHFAILFRTNEQPRAFELELRRERLRYVIVGGQSFFDRKEVRDVLAYVKLLANPLDEVSLLRVINTPSRGIGSTTVKALVAHALSQGKTLWEVLPEALEAAALSPAVRARVQGFVDLIERYRKRSENEPLGETVAALIQEIAYAEEVARQYKQPSEAEARLNSLQGVLRSLEEYEAREEEPTLTGFLESAALGGRDDFGSEKPSREYALTLMTLHSAKGLEFPHVYMVGMEEGLLPHRRVLSEGQGVEEERRLCYVGVTRAKDTLTLSLSKARNKWGKLRPSIPSRFLMEMRGDTEKAARAAAAGEQEVRAAAQAAERARAAQRSGGRARSQPAR